MFPILLIAIGIAVLLLGKRLAVLGAAVGALLGLALVGWLPGSNNPWLAIIVVIALAALGFFFAGFAKGIINIVLLVIGALAGAAIVMNFLSLLRLDAGLFYWLMAIVGGVIGLILIRRYNDLAMIILAGLIGGLLVTRGLTMWLPKLSGGIGTLLVLVLAGGSIVYQGGFARGRKTPGGTPAA
jgi:hypothetical protein